MSENELIIVVLGVVAVAVLVALTYLGKRMSANVETLALNLIRQTDAILAAYGPELKPAHDVIADFAALIDEDTDAIAKLLPANVRDALRKLLENAENLTDGEVETGA